jgi:hypothetical protein
VQKIIPGALNHVTPLTDDSFGVFLRGGNVSMDGLAENVHEVETLRGCVPMGALSKLSALGDALNRRCHFVTTNPFVIH